MDIRELHSAGDVIDALGGSTAVARLTGREGSQAASNWRASNSFPANTFIVLTDALARQGYSAPQALWRMVEPVQAAS